MNGQTGAPVLGGGVAGQPGEGVVLLQNKSEQEEGGTNVKKTPQISLFLHQRFGCGFVPEHVRGVVRVQRMGVFTVKKLV